MARPLTTVEALHAAAARFGEKPFIVDRRAGVTLSFAALVAEVDACARALSARGIARGDRVALWAPNSWRWIVSALATHVCGAMVVPLNTRFKGAEAAAILKKSRARLLLVENGFLGNDYLAQLGNFAIESVTLDDAGWSALHRTLAPRFDARATPEDASDLIFTSGTTGAPKGVVASHAQSCRVFATWSEIAGLGADDRYLVVNPFFHTFGYKAGWLACLLTGASCHPEPIFDVAAVRSAIDEQRITVLPGPPTLYQSLLMQPLLKQPSLRLAVTGAAVIPVELVRRMREELGFATVLTAYGLTEATGVVTMCRVGDELETIARTSGRAIPDTEVKILDSGEICVRGYNVMRGYFEDEEATRAAFTDDGWLRTGDVGALDERGNLRITDRLKDLFIVGGFNAYPAEIENALLEHGALAQVAVVGAPDERLGEVGVAFVVARAPVTPDEILAFARERLANFKVPRRVEIVEALPLNAIGKVQKFELRRRAAALVGHRA